MGDAQTAAETLIHSFDMSAVYTKWLSDIRSAQQCDYHPDKCGGAPSCTGTGEVPIIAPFFFGNDPDNCGEASDPAWAVAYIAIADYTYVHAHIPTPSHVDTMSHLGQGFESLMLLEVSPSFSRITSRLTNSWPSFGFSKPLNDHR
jgi:hypothetical protein